MAIYRVSRTLDTTASVSARHAMACFLVGLLLLVVIVPLRVKSEHFDRSNIRLTGVQAAADHRPSTAGWALLGVSNVGTNVVIDVTGPTPDPNRAVLRRARRGGGNPGYRARRRSRRSHRVTTTAPPTGTMAS